MHLIEAIAGESKGLSAPIPPTGLRVGKRPDNNLVLPDRHVSRRHARFDLVDGAVWLVDLGSTNGTYVNGVQIRRCVLRNGDEIEIGGTLFRYRDRTGAVDSPPPTREPGVTSVRRVQEVVKAIPSRARYPDPPESTSPRASAALAALARARPGTYSLDESLDQLLELVFDLFRVDRGCVVLLDEQKRTVPHAVRYRRGGAGDGEMPISQSLLQRAIEQGTALLIRDALEDPAAGSEIVAQRVRSVAYVPICFADEVLGVLCVDSQEADGLRESDLDGLVAFSHQAALVTYQARLQDEVRREEARRIRVEAEREAAEAVKRAVEREKQRSEALLHAIIPLGVALFQERDFDQLLDVLLREAMRFCTADAGAVYLRTPDERLQLVTLRIESVNLTLGGASGHEAAFPARPLYEPLTGRPNHRYVVADVVLRGAAVNFADAYSESGYDLSDFRALDQSTCYRSSSILSLPLQNAAGRVIGVLQLINALHPETGSIIPFTEGQQEMMETLSLLAALALDVQVRRQELQQRVRELQLQVDAQRIDHPAAGALRAD